MIESFCEILGKEGVINREGEREGNGFIMRKSVCECEIREI